LNNLKKLFVAISLTILFAGTTLADCTLTTPGEANGPPCGSTQQLTEDPADQVAPASTISNAIQVVVFDVVIDGLENLLTVY
jgi:hypothetical protein